MATKSELEIKFRNGARPSKDDFKDIFDSFVHKEEDGLEVDEEGNIQFTGGVQLGDHDHEALGSLRFHDNKVQYFNGEWLDIASGSGGVFQPVDSSTAVAYTAGNVGIGTFAAPPTYRLEVNLGRNTGEAERVRFGNFVCSNGPSLGTSGYAYIYNDGVSDNVNAAYALRQSPDGQVHINAPDSIPLSIRQNGTTVRLGVTANGNVVVGSEVDLTGAAYAFQVSGAAFKSAGGDNWNVLSDIRVKEEVRDLEAGLAELMRIRPVRFRYNGKGGTCRGEEGVGIIGQEIEQVFPEMVQQVTGGEEFKYDDLRIYNGSALKYVLVNAVKQLSEQVRELKQALAEVQSSVDKNTG